MHVRSAVKCFAILRFVVLRVLCISVISDYILYIIYMQSTGFTHRKEYIAFHSLKALKVSGALLLYLPATARAPHKEDAVCLRSTFYVCIIDKRHSQTNNIVRDHYWRPHATYCKQVPEILSFVGLVIFVKRRVA